MEVTFWGVRGSYPIARRENVRYGGNSACVHIRADGQDWILDSGSGIRPLGKHLVTREFAEGKGFARILLGHTHWDHILGFPFFEPFYIPGNRFEIYSAGQGHTEIKEILCGQQDVANFPVPFDGFRADFSFHKLSPDDNRDFDGTNLKTVQLNHQGMTLGFRLTRDNISTAIHTDTARIGEIMLGDNMETSQKFIDGYRRALREHADGVDLLIHDAHFNEHEILGKESWGHSTPRDAVISCKDAGVKKLALFHHAPEHSDAHVGAMLADAMDFAGNDLEVIGAAERITVHLGAKT